SLCRNMARHTPSGRVITRGRRAAPHFILDTKIESQSESGPKSVLAARPATTTGLSRTRLSRRMQNDVGRCSIASMSQVTRILEQIQQGDPHAAEQLLPLVYDELRKLAAQRLANEQPGRTLQATALVHEAYLRLVGDQRFDSRSHFFAAAAEAMRRILIEQARRKQRLRHGGDFGRQRLDEAAPATSPPVDTIDLLALNEALEKLEA